MKSFFLFLLRCFSSVQELDDRSTCIDRWQRFFVVSPSRNEACIVVTSNSFSLHPPIFDISYSTDNSTHITQNERRMDGSDAHHTHVIIIIIERESGVLAFFRHHNTGMKKTIVLKC